MKRLSSTYAFPLFLIVTALLFVGCSQEDIYNFFHPKDNTPADTSSWNLVFEDEFDDLSSWNVWYGGAFNNEIQLYREEQLSVDNSILTINALRASVSGPTDPYNATPKEFEYVSGRIESQEVYGPSDEEGEREYKFAARIKLPNGHGMWPAFWSYGDPWPTQGEIDVLEARGGEPDVFQSNIFYGTSPNVNINQNTEAVHSVGQDLTADFHVYEMIWRENSIDILFDEELIHTYTANSDNNISSLFGKEQKIVLNTAVGGFFFPDQNSSNYADSASMEVDWVRVYKR